MARRALTVAAAVLIVLSGCAALDEPTRQATSPSPLPAANGTDLDACYDAICEVEVREDDEIHLGPGWHVKTMEIQYLSEEKVTLWLKGMSGDQSSSLEGMEADMAVLEGHVTLAYNRPGRVNKIELLVCPGDGYRATLTLRPI